MTIDPYILLGIGSGFALLYAAVITLGWARTRRNRRLIQAAEGVSEVCVLRLGPTDGPIPERVRTVSLVNNTFTDKDGAPINVAEYKAYIAVGTSSRYPEVEDGNLMLFDATGELQYVFEVPDLSNYR